MRGWVDGWVGGWIVIVVAFGWIGNGLGMGCVTCPVAFVLGVSVWDNSSFFRYNKVSHKVSYPERDYHHRTKWQYISKNIQTALAPFPCS